MIKYLLPLAAVLLTACATPRHAPDTRAVDWTVLPGWQEERPAEAWSGLLATCARLGNGARPLATGERAWASVCADAALFPAPDDDTARAFFETRFRPYELRTEDSEPAGLVTGYYEPLLFGSRERSARFRYPLYGRPDDLLTVDLGELYPDLAGKRLRGRLVGRRVVPYFSRAQISANGPLNAPVLVWVDDPVALFFLQIQGSGRVQLPDAEIMHVGYADQNGHPYQAIGRRLIAMGALQAEEVSLQSIRAWLAGNPNESESVLNSNPSYVFFERRDSALPGPLGSLGVPLVAGRAVAVDPQHIPLGSLLWLDTTLPMTDESVIPTPLRRLVLAHDTGGAIKGALRVDYFFGFGPQAEDYAGRMKNPGRLYVLRPRPRG